MTNVIVAFIAAAVPLYSAQSYPEATGFIPSALTENGTGLALSYGQVGVAAVLREDGAEVITAPKAPTEATRNNFSLIDGKGRLYGFSRSGVHDYQGWIWLDGLKETITGLDFPVSGGSIDAVLIGSKSDGDFFRAARFEGGRSVLLPIPEGTSLARNYLLDSLTIARDTSRAYICGYGYFGDLKSMACLPLLWVGNRTTVLPLPARHLHGAATGVNNRGWIVGHTCTTPLGYNVFGNSLTTPDAPRWRACVWRNSQIEPLSEPRKEMITTANSWITKANDINSSGVIVGQLGVTNKEGEFRGFAVLWTGSQLIDLNKVINGKSAYHLDEAIKINNNGEILCVGVDSSNGGNVRVPVILRPMRDKK